MDCEEWNPDGDAGKLVLLFFSVGLQQVFGSQARTHSQQLVSSSSCPRPMAELLQVTWLPVAGGGGGGGGGLLLVLLLVQADAVEAGYSPPRSLDEQRRESLSGRLLLGLASHLDLHVRASLDLAPVSKPGQMGRPGQTYTGQARHGPARHV